MARMESGDPRRARVAPGGPGSKAFKQDTPIASAIESRAGLLKDHEPVHKDNKKAAIDSHSINGCFFAYTIFYSLTILLARDRTDSGIVTPILSAAVGFKIKSVMGTFFTGMSAGGVPLRILAAILPSSCPRT